MPMWKPRAYSMFGRGAALKKMQNYEIPLVRKLGEAIYEAMEEQWKRRGQAELMMMEMVEKSTEEMKYLEQNKELIKIGGQDALRSVAMLHKQLGHPSGARLVAAIQERNLPESYVKVARKYQCPTCLAKQQPKAVRVATLQKVPHFNHTLSIDTFYIQWENKKQAVFTMMDEFSRYEIDAQITDETAEMEIALMESTWMRCFGFPASKAEDGCFGTSSRTSFRRLVFSPWHANGADSSRSASQTGNLGAQPCSQEKDVGGFSNGDAGLQPGESFVGNLPPAKSFEFRQRIFTGYFGFRLRAVRGRQHG